MARSTDSFADHSLTAGPGGAMARVPASEGRTTSPRPAERERLVRNVAASPVTVRSEEIRKRAFAYRDAVDATIASRPPSRADVTQY